MIQVSACTEISTSRTTDCYWRNQCPAYGKSRRKAVLSSIKQKQNLSEEFRGKKTQMLNCNSISCGVLPIAAASSKSSDMLTPCRSSRTPGCLSRVSLNLSVSSSEKHWYVFPSDFSFSICLKILSGVSPSQIFQ